MQSRIEWTDEQWAKHLGTSVEKIPQIREIINDAYAAAVVRNGRSGKMAVAVYTYEITPSGFKRPLLSVTSNKEFEQPSAAIKYANEEFLPKLTLSKYVVSSLKVPAAAIQMLSIKGR